MGIPIKKWREMMLEAHLKLMAEIEARLENNTSEPHDYAMYMQLLHNKYELEHLLQKP